MADAYPNGMSYLGQSTSPLELDRLNNTIAIVRGVDLYPPPSNWVPPNCLFEVDDIQKEWTWKDPFDYIHLRQLLGAFEDDGWTQLYNRCYKYDIMIQGSFLRSHSF